MTFHSGIARFVFIGLTIGCYVAAGVGQSAKSIPIQITIDADHLTFVAGTTVNLRIEIKNVSNHEIAFNPPMSVNGREVSMCYDFHVRAEDGSIPKAIPLSGAILNLNHVITGEALGPGQSAVIAGNVGEWYDLTAPGKYRIYAFRSFGDAGEIVIIRSNEVTVTVLPKQQKAPR